jgi:hypothetical protein
MRRFVKCCAVVPLVGLMAAAALVTPAGASPVRARAHVSVVHGANSGTPKTPNINIVGKGTNSKYSPNKLTAPDVQCSGTAFTITNKQKVTQVVTSAGAAFVSLAPKQVQGVCFEGGTFGQQFTLGLESATDGSETGTLLITLGNPPGAPTFKKVTFSGTPANPTVTVTGKGFGTVPAGASDNATSCGSYSNNGDAYGATALWFQDTGNFVAGQGTPPSASCIGIIISSWSNTKVVFKFGNAYDTFGTWVLTSGDAFVLSVNAGEVAGTVSF